MWHAHHQSTRVRRSRFTNVSRNGERFFRRQQTHDGDRSPDVSDTRSHCFQSTRENFALCSHRTECAEKPEDTSRTSSSARRTGSNKSRTLQSTRKDQTKDSALLEVHKRHGFALLGVRGTQNLFSAEFTKWGRCGIPGNGAQHQRG